MNARSKHENATLEELERSNWGEPTYDSHLVKECHRLRRVRLRLLTLENLRILIGQNIGLQFLMPLAIEQLEQDPLAAGDFYPGDLLCSVLRVQPKYWDGDAEGFRKVAVIVERARKLAASEGNVVERAIEEAINVFARVGSGGSNNVLMGRRAKRARP
jgi:hypothetical protein